MLMFLVCGIELALTPEHQYKYPNKYCCSDHKCRRFSLLFHTLNVCERVGKPADVSAQPQQHRTFRSAGGLYSSSVVRSRKKRTAKSEDVREKETERAGSGAQVLQPERISFKIYTHRRCET